MPLIPLRGCSPSVSAKEHRQSCLLAFHLSQTSQAIRASCAPVSFPCPWKRNHNRSYFMRWWWELGARTSEMLGSSELSVMGYRDLSKDANPHVHKRQKGSHHWVVERLKWSKIIKHLERPASRPVSTPQHDFTGQLCQVPFNQVDMVQCDLINEGWPETLVILFCKQITLARKWPTCLYHVFLYHRTFPSVTTCTFDFSLTGMCPQDNLLWLITRFFFHLCRSVHWP